MPVAVALSFAAMTDDDTKTSCGDPEENLRDAGLGAMPYSPPWEPPESVPLTPEELARRRAEEDIDDAMDAVGNSGGRVDGLGVFGGGIFNSGARLSSYERTRERIVELIDKRAAEAAVAATMKAREDVLREEVARLLDVEPNVPGHRCKINLIGTYWRCLAAGCGAEGRILGEWFEDLNGKLAYRRALRHHQGQPPPDARCLFDEFDQKRARDAVARKTP